jgi:hypothetical protein
MKSDGNEIYSRAESQDYFTRSLALARVTLAARATVAAAASP